MAQTRRSQGSRKRPASQSKRPSRATKKLRQETTEEKVEGDTEEDYEEEEEGDAEELYKVEKIVGKKVDKNGVPLYKTRWEGYGASADTWEPPENVASTGHIE